MTATDVHRVLDALRKLTVWVDGGWGVDALAGTQTRPHDDLDLVVQTAELPAVRAVLTGLGFTTLLRDWLPAALAVADSAGRQIDLHPVDETGHQHLPDGSLLHYPPPVAGVIGDRPVRCMDRDTQLAHHSSYELKDKDRADIAVLQGL